MTQDERLDYLIHELIMEEEELEEEEIPESYDEKRKLLRRLMNIRMPKRTSKDFLKVQDEFLQEEMREIGAIYLDNLPTAQERRPGSKVRNADKIVLWQGDITRLAVDAIVNSASPRLLGCFIPNHSCVDNAIHSQAGIQLRDECEALMRQQNREEPVGHARITGAYNLPCGFVIHTVAPSVTEEITEEQEEELRSCYQSCLELAEKNKLGSLAFCSLVSEGKEAWGKIAAQIAVETIDTFLDHAVYLKKIVIDAYKERDYKVYDQLFRR